MGVQVLVLSPTRELALQTESVARNLRASSSWGSLSVIGGTKFQTDQKRLQTERADVLVGVRLPTLLSLYPATRARLGLLDYVLLKYIADSRPPSGPPPEWRSRTTSFESSLPNPRRGGPFTRPGLPKRFGENRNVPTRSNGHSEARRTPGSWRISF